MQEVTHASKQGWMSWFEDSLLHAVYESAKAQPFGTLLAILATICFFKFLNYRYKRHKLDHELVKLREASRLAEQVQQHKHHIDRIKARQQVTKD